MAETNTAAYSPEEDLGHFIMYEKFKEWLDKWTEEKEERDSLLKKLAGWAGVAERSPLALMLLAFIAGADAGVELIDNLEKASNEKSPACEEAQTGQATD